MKTSQTTSIFTLKKKGHVDSLLLLRTKRKLRKKNKKTTRKKKMKGTKSVN